MEYRVIWEGFPEGTWEPKKTIRGDLLRAWEKSKESGSSHHEIKVTRSTEKVNKNILKFTNKVITEKKE